MTARKSDPRAVWLASAVAVLPIAAVQPVSGPVEAAEPSAFSPPSDAMILTRVLRRALPGAAAVVVTRSYEIRIHPQDGGYLVEGRLVDVKTEVPAPYEALARLERERPDDGLFPMRLDRLGRLVASGEAGAPAAAQAASSAALSKIGRLGLSRAAAQEAKEFVNKLATNPSRTAWPEDLFRPVPGTRNDTRAVPLPNGETGEISVSIDASADRHDGLLDSFQRVVTTRLGGTDRVTQETWTLLRKG